jgi:hypothetical protein
MIRTIPQIRSESRAGLPYMEPPPLRARTGRGPPAGRNRMPPAYSGCQGPGKTSGSICNPSASLFVRL